MTARPAQTPPPATAAASAQHTALAMTTLARIKRYTDADLGGGRPSLEHAEMILAASVVYLKEATKAGKDEECAARHAACGEIARREAAA